MIDKIIYTLFNIIDNFFGWIYDKFICDKSKKNEGSNKSKIAK